LDESSFDEATVEDAWLIGFSCSSAECKKMEEALAAVQKTHSLHLRVGVVDCTSPSGTSLCREHAATSPSAILFYKERGFLFVGEHSSDSYLAFVGEGFKKAPSRNRLHLSMKRRLSIKSISAEAVRDFAHQHRYLIAICFCMFLMLWGMFIGSAMSTSPAKLRDSILSQLSIQQKQQAAAEKKKRG
jgi:hypothetical protein